MKGDITLSSLQAAGLAIVVLVVIVSIGGQLLGEVQSGIKTTVNTQTDNASLTSGVTAQQIGGAGNNPINFVGLHVWNSTSNVVPSGNWTLSTTGIFNLTEANYENDTLTLTFTNDHDLESIAYNTTSEGLDAMSEFSDWFTIVVIVLIAVVVIALLVRGLGGTTQGV